MEVMARVGCTNKLIIKNGNGHDTCSKDVMHKQEVLQQQEIRSTRLFDPSLLSAAHMWPKNLLRPHHLEGPQHTTSMMTSTNGDGAAGNGNGRMDNQQAKNIPLTLAMVMKVVAKNGCTNNLVNSGNCHGTYSKDGMHKQEGQ